MKMLPTTHNSIVFPDTLPKEALDFFNQMLLFDIELLLLNKQLEQFKKYQLDEKKKEIDKQQKELFIERICYQDEIHRAKQKLHKLNMAISKFLIKSAELYKNTDDTTFNYDSVKSLTSNYQTEDRQIFLAHLFDETMDDGYNLTLTQRNFLNFARRQNEANIHYKNALEIKRKIDECNASIHQYNEKAIFFDKNVLESYNREVNSFNQLNNKKDLVASQKEKVFKEFLEKMDDASLQEHIEKLVQNLR